MATMLQEVMVQRQHQDGGAVVQQGTRESRMLPMDPQVEGGPVLSYEYPRRGQVPQQSQEAGPPCGQLVAWQAAPGTEQMGPGQLARVQPG